MWRVAILLLTCAVCSTAINVTFVSFNMSSCGQDKAIPPNYVKSKLTTTSLVHCAMECGRDYSACENFDYYPGSQGENCHIGSVTNTSNIYGSCNNMVYKKGSKSFYKKQLCPVGMVFDNTKGSCICGLGFSGTNCTQRISDCNDTTTTGFHFPWVHPPNAPAPFRVKCYDRITFILTRAYNIPLDFNRTFAEYANGFGILTSSFYLGNKKLHYITNTSTRDHHLMIQLYGHNFVMFYRYYFKVKVGTESENFKISVQSSKSGQDTDQQGDALMDKTQPNLSIHNMEFSAYDMDNDQWATGSCAKINGGGWWYNQCTGAPLTAKFMNATQLAASGGRSAPGHVDWITMPNAARDSGISVVNVGLFT